MFKPATEIDAKASAAIFDLGSETGGYRVTVVRSRDNRHERWAYGEWHSPADAMEVRRDDFRDLTPPVERAYLAWLEGAPRCSPGESCAFFVSGDPEGAE